MQCPDHYSSSINILYINKVNYIMAARKSLMGKLESSRDSIPLKRIEEILSKKSFKDFRNWFAGQTGEIINGELCVYEWDFLRWIHKKPVVD
jgi:hypothetical protein